MALTFGQMRDQILAETYRDATFQTAVENAIVSAIKELEIQQLFINQTFQQLTLNQGSNTVNLPADFMSVLMMVLLDSGGTTVYTEASGFKQVPFWDLQTFQYQNIGVPSNPGLWSIYDGQIWVYPIAQQSYLLDLYYYNKDATYPSNYNDTSIWLGDYTQDVTRYTARGIFYRDSLQSPELAASEFAKAADVLAKLKLRNSQRATINTLSV